jgi:hypothetical protein
MPAVEGPLFLGISRRVGKVDAVTRHKPAHAARLARQRPRRQDPAGGAVGLDGPLPQRQLLHGMQELLVWPGLQPLLATPAPQVVDCRNLPAGDAGAFPIQRMLTP